MSLELPAALVLFAALCAYAIFAGADFGGGFWTAFAFGPRRREVREAIFEAIGPVWETNHVWLILILVTLWSAFPPAFSALFVNLYLPLTVALIGVIFRGAAFAFRHFGHETGGSLPATGLVFSMASIVTPFAMGVSVGAVAAGNVSLNASSRGIFEAWLQPFPLVCGLLGVGICAFLTPFYMLAHHVGRLAQELRRMALAGSLGLGALTTLALPVALLDAPDLADRYVRPLPLLLAVLAVVFGVASILVAWKRLHVLGPPVAAGAVVLTLAAWGAAQNPYILLPDTRLSDVASPDATLRAFLIVLPIGAALLIPSLVWLYSLFAASPLPETPTLEERIDDS